MHRWCHEVADKQMSSNYLHKKIYLAISDAAADVATCWYFLRKKMMNGNGGKVSRSSVVWTLKIQTCQSLARLINNILFNKMIFGKCREIQNSKIIDKTN